VGQDRCSNHAERFHGIVNGAIKDAGVKTLHARLAVLRDVIFQRSEGYPGDRERQVVTALKALRKLDRPHRVVTAILPHLEPAQDANTLRDLDAPQVFTASDILANLLPHQRELQPPDPDDTGPRKTIVVDWKEEARPGDGLQESFRCVQTRSGFQELTTRDHSWQTWAEIQSTPTMS
jgi:hypothetical protein